LNHSPYYLKQGTLAINNLADLKKKIDNTNVFKHFSSVETVFAALAGLFVRNHSFPVPPTLPPLNQLVLV